MPSIKVVSGCSTVGGNVNCPPEQMRARAEAQGLQQGWWPAGEPLTLTHYTLARYMTSEVGSGTPEERVAVGEAVVNRARLAKTDVNGMLLYRQVSGHPNRGWYGPIHGPEGVSSAPYGRWAATSKDPTSVNLLLAKLILDGSTDNFAMGADDQNGMQYFENPAANVRKQADQGDYWVGPLPGVNHWHTFLYRHFGVDQNTPTGQLLLQRGLAAVANRASPDWSGLPYCSGGAGLGVGGVLGLGVVVVAALGSGFLLARRLLGRVSA